MFSQDGWQEGSFHKGFVLLPSHFSDKTLRALRSWFPNAQHARNASGREQGHLISIPHLTKHPAGIPHGARRWKQRKEDGGEERRAERGGEEGSGVADGEAVVKRDRGEEEQIVWKQRRCQTKEMSKVRRDNKREGN